MKITRLLLPLLLLASAQLFSACWEGLYLSGQLGEGWSNRSVRFKNANYFNTLGPSIVGTKFHMDSDHFIGGGALGYNYQCGCYVLGIEAGALYGDFHKKRKSPFFPDLDDFSSDCRWITSVKAKAGITYDQFLFFVSGGWSGADVSLKLDDHTSNIQARSKKWVNGWNAGAGFDYQCTDQLSLGISYDYIDLTSNHRTLSCPDCGIGVGFGTPKVEDKLHVQSVLFRINYLFAL